MRNEGHFLILHELAEKEKVYKDRFNINRADSDKQLRPARYFLLQNYSGISQPQDTFSVAFDTFSLFHTFQLKLWSTGDFLTSRN